MWFRRVATAALAVSLLALVSLSVRAAEPSALESSVETLTVEEKIPREGDFLAFGFGSVWMMSDARLVRVDLVRVDPADNSVVDIEVPESSGLVRGIGVGENAVWIPDVLADLVYKVDPATNKVVQSLAAPMNDPEGSIGVGEGAIWVVTEEDDHKYLTRFNAGTGAEEAKISLPGGIGVVVDYGYVWVTDEKEGELYRIDPRTNSIASATPLRGNPRFITSGEGSVWVLNQSDGTVQRVDGRTGEVAATIETGAPGGRPGRHGGDIATGGGYVWVAMPGMPVAQIDPGTNTLVRRFTGYGMGDAIRFGAGSVWVSGPSIHRIRPPS
jgi:streptogramin lyase